MVQTIIVSGPLSGGQITSRPQIMGIFAMLTKVGLLLSIPLSGAIMQHD